MSAQNLCFWDWCWQNLKQISSYNHQCACFPLPTKNSKIIRQNHFASILYQVNQKGRTTCEQAAEQIFFHDQFQKQYIKMLTS